MTEWPAFGDGVPLPSDSWTHRPRAKPSDVITTLRHFAIVTYAVPPERVAGLVDERFALDTIQVDGQERALISVVPFEDEDFRWAASDGPRWRFGQTNYRIYVRDRQTGKRAVWFLGTTLGSWRVVVPRYLWRLPWHYGRFTLTCEQVVDGQYSTYRIETRSRWAPLALELEHHADAPLELPGFASDPARYLAVKWIPPKWDWVDPLKDRKAEIEAIEAGLKSRSDVIESEGYDAEEVDRRIAADHAREEELGLKFGRTATARIEPAAEVDPEDRERPMQSEENAA